MPVKPKRKFILIYLLLIVALFFGLAAPLLADEQVPQCAGGGERDEQDRCPITNPAPGYFVDFKDFGQLLRGVVKVGLQFAGAIAVIFLVVGGYQYVVSRGNEEAMEKAKKTITSAVIGIIIISLAFAIVQIVDNLVAKQATENIPQTPP